MTPPPPSPPPTCTRIGPAGAAGPPGTEGGGGKVAQFISNASFFTLMLIFSFTEVLDLSDQISIVAGLSSRVGEMLRLLPGNGGGGGGGGGGSGDGVGRRDEERDGEREGSWWHGAGGRDGGWGGEGEEEGQGGCREGDRELQPSGERS